MAKETVLTLKTVSLEKHGDDVYVLVMKAGENRFHPTFMQDMHTVLDAIEKTSGPAALIVMGDPSSRFFSNGLDVNYMATLSTHEETLQYLRDFQRLLARFLILGMPTVAAINGHCYAGGAMLSLACDFRIMRGDKGFWCMPEVDLHMPLPPGMNAIVQAKIDSPVLLRDIVLLGKKYGGVDAAAFKIVDKAADEKSLFPAAFELAKACAPKGDDREVFRALKIEMYRNAHTCLTQEYQGEVKSRPKMLANL